MDALKHATPNTQMMGYPNDGVLKVLDSNQKSGLVPFQGCLSSREAEGLSDMSASSLLLDGRYESNVFIFISFSGPSDAYSSTLSPLNFNL